MLSTPVSGVATRNATVAPGVAPCLRSPSAVGRTPQEHKGMGAPTTDPQSTDLIFPAPTSPVSSRPGTRIPSIPASRKPKRRKTEASSKISQVCRRTPNRKLIIVVSSSRPSRPNGSRPSGLRRGGLMRGGRRGAAALLRQIFLVQRAGHGELRVDHVGDVEMSRLTKQLDGIVLLEAIV